MSNITLILQAVESGDAMAAEDLLPLVYEELRILARHRISYESADQTLQATALVHEAYLRLVENCDPRWQNRGHFFAAAAEAMRRILVDRARSRGQRKRGGDRVRIELLDHADAITEDPALVLSVDELLIRLGEDDADSSHIAHLHLFGGLSVEEAGGVLGFSRTVAYRNWKFARAWLREALEP